MLRATKLLQLMICFVNVLLANCQLCIMLQTQPGKYKDKSYFALKKSDFGRLLIVLLSTPDSIMN